MQFTAQFSTLAKSGLGTTLHGTGNLVSCCFFFLLLRWSRRVMKSEEGLVIQKSLSLYRYMLNSLPWLAKMPSK